MINDQVFYKKVISSISLKESLEIQVTDSCEESSDCCSMDAPESIPTGGADFYSQRNFFYRSDF